MFFVADTTGVVRYNTPRFRSPGSDIADGRAGLIRMVFPPKACVAKHLPELMDASFYGRPAVNRSRRWNQRMAHLSLDDIQRHLPSNGPGAEGMTQPMRGGAFKLWPGVIQGAKLKACEITPDQLCGSIAVLCSLSRTRRQSELWSSRGRG